jgi:plasmid replication initiation protein
MGRKELKVYKDNKLIDARYRLTFNEQRFVLFAISKIERGMRNGEYSFHIREFARLVGGENNREIYRVFRALVKLIMRKPLCFCPDEDTEVICNWFSSVKYKRNSAIVSFRFAQELEPYLFDLQKRFTTYSLKQVLKFRSIYSIRFYELLKRDEWIGETVISIEKLRAMLGLENMYPSYGSFKQKVIEVARKELKFSYKEVKEGRKVVGIILEQ